MWIYKSARTCHNTIAQGGERIVLREVEIRDKPAQIRSLIQRYMETVLKSYQYLLHRNQHRRRWVT